MKTKRGKYFVFEGADGSGKSTQCKMFVDYLRGRKLDVIHLREPGSTKVGEEVRKILLDRHELQMDALTELFLFEASRTQLAKEVIQPCLEAGRIVVSDRSGVSSLVYQGFAGAVNPENIVLLNNMAYLGLSPDRVYILTVPLKVALGRRGSLDRMESKGMDFQKRVSDGYRRVAEFYPDVKFIDGRGSVKDVHRNIVRDFERRFASL